MSKSRRLGQNFLVDRRAVRRIVAELDAQRGESLLEIGPGRGALTGELIEQAGRIAAVELDGDLARRLRDRYSEEQLVLISEDILRVSLAEVRTRLGGAQRGGLVIVGNLPYNISKPIAQKLVRERAQVERAMLMFQREVAERLTAGPGSKSYGPLSVLAGQAFDIRAVFHLPPTAFRPRPKVESTVTAWQRRPPSALPADREARLRTCLSACFAGRRKTLRNNLRAALRSDDQAQALLHGAGLDGSLRAERVGPQGFLRLAEIWPGEPPAA